MHITKSVFIFFWRIWFYIVMITTIVIMSPILLVVTSHDALYPIFYKIAHYWGKLILFCMGFKVAVLNPIDLKSGKSYMFSANHTSMIDIMLILAIIPTNPFVFVGKAELVKIPVFGFFYKRTSILVNRSDAKSRQAVYLQAQKRLKKGLSVCIFPEGMVPNEDIVLNEFKNGAFVLAIEHGIPLVPIAFLDCKKRFSYTFFSGGPGVLRVKFHQPIETSGMNIQSDKEILKNEIYNLIYKDLEDLS